MSFSTFTVLALTVPVGSYLIFSLVPMSFWIKISFGNSSIPQFLFDLLASKQFQSIFDALLGLRSQFWRLITGKSDLARVLEEKKSANRAKTSSGVDAILSGSLDLPTGSEFDTEEISHRIWKSRIDNRVVLGPSFHNLNLALEDVKRAVVLKNQLNATKNIPYDSNNVEHENKLEKLWGLLRPGVARERISRQWGDIGFQGKDPATDFRAMGILGLDQLLYFAVHHPNDSANTLRDSMVQAHNYPFAITGINITAFLLKLLEEKRLNYLLYRNGFNFDEIYSLVFVLFNRFYISQKPRNLMDFGPIFQKFKTRLAVFLYFRTPLDFRLLHDH